LYSKLNRQCTSNNSVFIKRVDKGQYESHNGQKTIIRGKRIHKLTAKKRRRFFEKQYYIALGDQGDQKKFVKSR
jgi:hypothetical protein